MINLKSLDVKLVIIKLYGIATNNKMKTYEDIYKEREKSDDISEMKGFVEAEENFIEWLEDRIRVFNRIKEDEQAKGKFKAFIETEVLIFEQKIKELKNGNLLEVC